jgi:hypothetical protein
MKTPFAFLRVFAAMVCVGSVAMKEDRALAALEVHEWGTFTVVSGSDGVALSWYQPEQALVELPNFVARTPIFFGKTGTGTLTLNGSPLQFNGQPSRPSGFLSRMETPVIYFYPSQPMDVSVQVTFPQGRLTEWFPFPTIYTHADMTWKGSLFAPDSANSSAHVPEAIGSHGAHYAHAREVPKAWYFGTKSGTGQRAKDIPLDPWEKFIFYRGAADTTPPFQANSLEAGRMKLMRFDTTNKPVVAFALQVEGNRARWMRMPDLAVRNGSGSAPAPVSEIRLQGEPKPIAEVSAELGSAMTTVLAQTGLSEDEAKAMVATWSDAWFQENGSRIFALLPRDWIDATLPLTITPKPEKITRVFVGRFELFTPEVENTLLTMLKPGEVPNPAAAAKLRDLRLGRFATAALQRSKNLMEQYADLQFSQLQQAALQPATAAR